MYKICLQKGGEVRPPPPPPFFLRACYSAVHCCRPAIRPYQPIITQRTAVLATVKRQPPAYRQAQPADRAGCRSARPLAASQNKRGRSLPLIKCCLAARPAATPASSSPRRLLLRLLGCPHPLPHPLQAPDTRCE